MKKVIISVIIFAIIFGMISCTDVQGDGMYEDIWEGSSVPEDSSYWNPVWEPDLSFPVVFEAAVGYYAIGADKEWTEGLIHTTPVLSSSDLMSWRFRGEAFEEKPDWSGGRISTVSAGFAKTKGTYFIFYTLEDAGIGMGASKAPQGPYTDFGLLVNSDAAGLAECKNPFFYAYGANAYIFYQGGDGMYGQELILSKTELAVLKGDKFKITGAAINSMNMTKLFNYYYLFGGIDDGDEGRITIGRSLEITGPFIDQDGNSMYDGEGTLLLRANSENGFVAASYIGGILQDSNENIWIIYQATDINMPTLSTGVERYPLLLSKIEFNENGWPTQVFEAKAGWNNPKFAN